MDAIEKRARELLARHCDSATGYYVREGKTPGGVVTMDSAVRAVAAALADTAPWQPLDTAPKDGRWLILGKVGTPGIIMGYWHIDARSWYGQADRRHGLCDDATHWLPLPVGPAAEVP